MGWSKRRGPGLGLPGEPEVAARGQGPARDWELDQGPGLEGCYSRANIFSNVVLIKDRMKFCVLKLEQMFVLIF